MKLRFRSALPLLVAALVLAPAALAAQETPEQVAERYFDTFRRGDWAGTTQLMHPSALEDFKGAFVRMAEMAGAEAEGDDMEGMFGVRTTADLKALASTELYSRFMTRMGSENELQEMFRQATVQVFGHVMEGADTAHVVHRLTFEVMGSTMTQVQVMSLRKDGAQWKVLLSADIQTMVNSMQAGMAMPPMDDEEPLEPEEPASPPAPPGA